MNPMELKREILLSSQQLFMEKGYRKVTYKQIADMVGISKSLLQYYFPKKNELLKELMNQNFNKWIKTIPTTDLYTKLATFLLMFFDFISENKQIRKFMIEIIDNNELFNSFMSFFSDWLENKEFTQQVNDKFKAALLFSFSGGLQLFRFKDNYKMPIKQITRVIMMTLLKLIGMSNRAINEILAVTDSYYAKLKISGWQLIR